jgi:hypothetical protein
MAFIILVLIITPNGKQIILSGDVDTSENQDRSLESEIFIMDADGGNFKMLLGENGKDTIAPHFHHRKNGWLFYPALPHSYPYRHYR